MLLAGRLILNPKAIRMGELYGEFNDVTNEWTDGLVAQLVRQACADTSDTRKWIMFDGPVDTLWIEVCACVCAAVHVLAAPHTHAAAIVPEHEHCA